MSLPAGPSNSRGRKGTFREDNAVEEKLINYGSWDMHSHLDSTTFGDIREDLS